METEKSLKPYRHTEADQILTLIAAKLQLPQEKREKAEKKYHELGKLLEAEGSPFKRYSPEIYAQGSMAIGTTVKPKGRDEYDLDAVLQMDLAGHPTYEENPVQLLVDLEKHLQGIPEYKGVVEKRTRCVCLNFPGDFHLDVIPATPEGRTFFPGCIKVPDRNERDWKPSNPKGFAEWINQAAKHEIFGMVLASCRVEPVPGEEPARMKPPLKRVIQLLKRHRDMYFNGSGKKKPPSIILTTLAGEASLLIQDFNPSVAGVFIAVLEYIQARIDQALGILKVVNPSNPDERFSDKWEEEEDGQARYEWFKEWVAKALGDVREIGRLEPVRMAAKLKEMFGEEITKSAFLAQAKGVREARERGELYVVGATGTLLATKQQPSTERKVQDHQFHDEKETPSF